MTNIRREEITTEALADLPTPSVPFLELYPSLQLIKPIVNPKKKDFINEGITSRKSRNRW